MPAAGRSRERPRLLDPDLASGHRARVTERTSIRGAQTQAHAPEVRPEELLAALHRQVFVMAAP
ncbi:hypothetical protein [Streptomyces chrestomyceticus]|uniref:hypothetical protein n=1 Tax=Streptomyces chrestomyceticus TaxID=68185 RepID=UPI0033F2B3CC